MDIKILLAEDEPNIRKLVAGYLIREGFKVIEAQDGQDALVQFEDNPDIDLAVLDIMMPHYTGIEVCQRIRQSHDVPVLFLTALGSEEDELQGFRVGADEYISKPFSPSILVTRIKNLLRRTDKGSLQNIDVEGLSINYTQRTVTVDGEEVTLTPKEFDLLYYLMLNRNIALSRDQLINAVWDINYFGDYRTVDTHVKCVRQKIGKYGDMIVTVRKVGYKFDAKI